MSTRSQALAAIQGITNFASGYANDVIAQSVLADAYFLTGDPIKTALNFEYAQFDRADGISIPDTKTAANDPVGALLVFGGTKITGTLDAHRATTDWYDASANVSDADLLLQLQSGVRQATQALVTGRFQRILSAAATAAGAGTNLSLATADPIDAIQEQVQNVMLACGGYCRPRVLIGASAYRKITALTKFQNRIAGAATVNLPSTPTEQQIANAIGLGVEVKVTNAVFNSAAPGQTAAGAFLLADTIYIAATSPSPSTQDPSALKVFEGNGSNGMTPVFMPHPNSVHEAATWGWMEKVQATNTAAVKRLNVVA
jgi:hypothetical protein